MSKDPLARAFWLNLAFAIFEVFGGFFTNSLAILTDALHDFGDAAVIFFAWQLEKLSRKKPDHKYHYGYQRYSLLAALVTGFILALGSLLIIKESLPRIWQTTEVYAPGMLFFALVGIFVNFYAIHHLHKEKGLNQKMVKLHLLEDAFGWIVVFFGSIVIWIWQVHWVDPLLSIGLNLFILYNVFRNLWQTFGILMQRAPQNITREDLERELSVIPEIENIHALYLWSLDGHEHILSLHVVLKRKYSAEKIAQIKKEIRQRLCPYNISHATIELEFQKEPCESRANYPLLRS